MTASGVRAPAPLRQLRDLELLLLAHHPVILIETIEEERAEGLLEHVADHLDMLYLQWRAGSGLVHMQTEHVVKETATAAGCLQHILGSQLEALYYLRDFAPYLTRDELRPLLRDAQQALWRHRGAIVFTTSTHAELPDEVLQLVTTVTLKPASDMDYHRFLSAMLRDMRRRRQVKMDMTPKDVARLIQQLRGLTFFEVKKVVTQAVAESWSFDKSVIERALEAKQDVLRQSGVLEYTPATPTMADIAGLSRLKHWLRTRKAVFANPDGARDFGLTAPRGVLLLGVPGCGKSLAAKAVASEYGLPLVRLDPARLYTKYIGDTEKNLRKAMRIAEAMAPIVLWIDEIEKGLAPGDGGGDAGVSQRVLGSFLSWMQDKVEGVFVVATCNDISELPPELLRKGRFDEIFFVDLPTPAVRQQILAVHLRQRGRTPDDFDLPALAAASPGFSGAELEQAVVGGLYRAYAAGEELRSAHVEAELRDTRPLSVTSAEKLARLRAWAERRAVRADSEDYSR